MNSFRRSIVSAVFAAVLALGSASGVQASPQEDQVALLTQLKGLLEARGITKFIVPAPGSRSTILSVDVSTRLFFFLERGSIRGSAIDEFYAALETGDMETIHSSFLVNAIMTLRVTDYGWNGVGTPLVTGSGSEVPDIVFKDIGGVFTRAPEISEEDIETFTSLVRDVIALLESS